MPITESLVTELKDLLASEYRLDLTNEQARDMAESLVKVYRALLGCKRPPI